MAYVPTDDLKRMCRMLMSTAERYASNYCFANKHDEPGDVENVTMQVLNYFESAIHEVRKESECVKGNKSRV